MKGVVLKKRDLVLFKLSVFFFSMFLVGLLAYWIAPGKIILFIVDWRWAAFALGIILGIRVWWKVWKSVYSTKEVSVKKVKRKKRK